MRTFKSAIVFYVAFILVVSFGFAGTNVVRAMQNNYADDVKVICSSAGKDVIAQNIVRRGHTQQDAHIPVMMIVCFCLWVGTKRQSAFNHSFPDVIGSHWQIYAKIAIPARAAPHIAYV